MPLIPQAELPPGENDLSPADHIRAAIEHLQAAQVDEADDTDSGQIAKLIQGLYAILSAQQDSDDRMMGSDPGQMRALRRAYSG